MRDNFFQTFPIPLDTLQGSYDLRLVILSFLVATAASYIALDLTARLRDVSNTPKTTFYWWGGGAIALGAGIWAMHFIGMLSFTIPGISLRYEFNWTIFSLIVAIVASGFALYLLKSPVVTLSHYVAGGALIGIGIASMHYTGMEALLITLNIRYLPSLFLLSIAIAIAASLAAMWLALKSTHVVIRIRSQIKLISAVIMGIAICGMHYTGMAASIFTLCATPQKIGIGALDPGFLAMAIAAVTFVILGIAFFASVYKENLNHQQLEKARQLVMAEISASVLHNVGNVMNSVNVSANMIEEKLKKTKLLGLNKLAELFNENKNDLVNFITSERGAKAIEYLQMLATYWCDEQAQLNLEISRVTKNINFIKEIISTQQELSKTSGYEEVISIKDLLEEAILISGFSMRTEILVKKAYERALFINGDKVKLLQVLVNILRNAKDALLESTQVEKVVTVSTSTIDKNHIRIEISDNGIGIAPKNQAKVFNYGFTTKKSGHGFGMHTAALAINAMGGQISIYSAGIDHGATVTIELPCNYLKR